MAGLQTHRALEITTPLGEDVLLFHRMTATEELSRLFRFELDLLSENHSISFEDLLGQKVTVRLELPHDKNRYFNGFVSRFSQTGTLGNYALYHATVHPWLWFLTRNADCRIFQDKTVPDIIKQVFRDHGFTDFEEALSGSYRTWEYCVQYRETDFNFVSRLMEQEGIYYYFKHDKTKHTLVLADSISSHEPFPGYQQVRYRPPDDRVQDFETIYDWHISKEVQPGTYSLNDFDFKKPRANLLVKSSQLRRHSRAASEIYDYPGEYIKTEEGETLVRARIQELQAEYEQLQGQANARGLSVGCLFNLIDFPRKDQNREYLIVSATHHLESDMYESGMGGGGEIYTCSFTAMPGMQPFRPARSTPKPMVQGPQTAIVVGPSGSEIYTEEYARIKVRFHWDRKSKGDENSSCWIRVAQLWAGSRWGGIHIPRIGQEVMVEFLEGDPDRPIITGRVYNNDNKPPYDLPAKATQSGVKSRSSKNGNPNNYNEIRFEDEKGNEEILIHAERNMKIEVEKDEDHEVEHDRTITVKNDEKHDVLNNRTTTIMNNDTQTVNNKRDVTIATTLTINCGLGATIVCGASGLTINSAGPVSISASAGITLTAPTITLAAPIVQCAGIVQCVTLMTTSVISSTYTPGLGNIL